MLHVAQKKLVRFLVNQNCIPEHAPLEADSLSESLDALRTG